MNTHLAVTSAKIRCMLSITVFSFQIAITSGAAFASDFRWNVSTSGNFATSGNWLIYNGSTYVSTSSVPGSADIANINYNTTDTPTITLTANRTVSVLDNLGDDVTLSFGTSTLTVSNHVETTRGFLGNGVGRITLTSGTLTTVDLTGVGSTSVESIAGTFRVTGSTSTLNVSDQADITQFEVLSGAKANVAKRIHTDGYTYTKVDGAGSELYLSTVHTTTSPYQVSNNGYLKGGNATVSTSSISTSSTLSLTNGVADFAAVTLNSGTFMGGYGVLIRGALTGSGTNNLLNPTGAVNITINFDVSSRTGYVYSNALAQFSGTISISGGTLNTTDGSGTEGLSLTGSGMISGYGTVLGGTGGLTGASGTKLNATGGTLILDQTASSTFSGVVQGSGNVTVQNSGTLTLAGTAANTLSGTTTVKGGVLALNKTAGVNALAGPVTVGDGTGNDILRLAASNQLSDSSILTFIGTGSNAGIFRLNNQSDTAGGIASTSNAGIIENESGASGTGTLTISVAATSSFSGILRNGDGSGTDGTLALVKAGSGTQTLAGASANTFSGTTTINGGILALAKTAGVSAVAGNITIGDGATSAGLDILRLDASNQIADSSIVAFNGSGANAGILRLNNQSETVAAITSTGGTGIIENESGASGTGTLTVAISSGSQTFSGVLRNGDGTGTDGVLALTKSSAGTLVLSGASTFTGATTINAGTLQIAGSSNRLPATTAVTLANTAGTQLDLNNFDQTIGSLAGGGASGGNVSLGTGNLTVGDATSTAFAGNLTATTGNLIKQGTGTLSLSGANTLNAVTLNAGTFALTGGTLTAASWQQASGASLSLTGGTLTVNNGAFTQANGPVVISGASSPTFALTGSTTSTNGTQALVVGNLSGQSGTLSVSSGSLLTSSGDDSFFGLFGTMNVYSGYSFIGLNTGSSGQVTVTGTNSRWLGTSGLYVAARGIGNLDIQNGGQVTCTYGYVASEGGSNGTSTITGSNSKFTISNQLFVGKSSTGTINVQAGGSLITNESFLAYGGSGNGTVNVTGSGSTWSNTGNVYLGGTDFASGGTGLLTISSGGQATISGTLNLWNNGTVTLNGGSLSTATLTASSSSSQIQLLGTALDNQIVIPSGTSTFIGSVQGSSGFQKAGFGTLVLAGSNTYGGNTYIYGGELQIPTINNNAVTTVAAGSTLRTNQLVQSQLSINGTTGSPAQVVMNASPGDLAGSSSGTSTVGSLSLAYSGPAAITSPPPTGYSGPLRSYYGVLDLSNNDLIIQAATLADISDMIRGGMGNTTTLPWNGNGLKSSYAQSGLGFAATGLGVIRNITDPTQPTGSALYASFGGQPVSGNEVLVKYTWYGDFDVNGSVNALDFALLDAGFAGSTQLDGLPGWYYGDVNLDGLVNSFDHALALAGYTGYLGNGNTQLPEPSSLLLTLCGLGGLLAGYRTRPTPVPERHGHAGKHST